LVQSRCLRRSNWLSLSNRLGAFLLLIKKMTKYKNCLTYFDTIRIKYYFSIYAIYCRTLKNNIHTTLKCVQVFIKNNNFCFNTVYIFTVLSARRDVFGCFLPGCLVVLPALLRPRAPSWTVAFSLISSGASFALLRVSRRPRTPPSSVLRVSLRPAGFLLSFNLKNGMNCTETVHINY
jgi:hypothetical protein